jgi:hypothetical protein
MLDCCAVARYEAETNLFGAPDFDFVHTVSTESKKDIARY